ncbi:uncharacterized protein EV420DRAFT_1184180 [Desarmillaria tabescens]|uniref:Uncharacterized protein n=1 Tax=Armillaria tabescens TaxID=1929756 RepID=A0AA39TKK2_ARMTA|nr:uncharacterized protein EV420DRAFT_1184180 [Desarmillaria tabescens]KAK0462372.1 hypothetical protein EV420DRAFT_1184180 [Desarmillaria tabescens]
MASAVVPKLPDEEVDLIFTINGLAFNRCIISALAHGIYTSIFMTTLWNIFALRPKDQSNTASRKIMLAVITALYILGTFSVGMNWAFTRYSFITHGQNFWTIFSTFNNISAGEQKASTLLLVDDVATGISSVIQNILVDFAIIWRCWMVWGRRWSAIFVPILCMIVEIIANVFEQFYNIRSILDVHDPESFHPTSVDWTMVYLSLSLAVTLLCTILIVFRIVTVGRANRDEAFGGYQAIVEIMAESAALLSIISVIYMVTYARGSYTAIYVDVIAASIRGTVPTLLVGRVASGRSRPDDTWKGSVLSSLHFGTRNHVQTQSSTQYNGQHSTPFSPEDDTPHVNDSLEESNHGAEAV